jgi:uncharacterized DUF497 family protein
MRGLGFDGFDWDKGNATKSLVKHGISMAMVEALFKGQRFIAADPKHSQDEARFLAVGITDHGRWMLVSFTLRLKDARPRIRPISARYMHAKEVKGHEKGKSN